MSRASTRRSRPGALAIVLVAAFSMAACEDGEPVVSGSDAQLARDALVRESDLPRGYDDGDRPATDVPFRDPAPGCEALAPIADAETVAREGSGALVAPDTSRWLVSTVWVFADDAGAIDAIRALRGLGSVDCFGEFFAASFIEATIDQSPRPFLVLDTIDSAPLAIGDGGARIEGIGRFTAGEVESSLTVAFSAVRTGRSLAMLHTIVGGDPDPDGDADLLTAMVARLAED